MEYGFIYIWYDRKRKMFYIGSHWGKEDDGYICSSTRMRNAHRRRPEDFKRRIIGYNYISRRELFEQEEVWLQKINPRDIRKKYYNVTRVTKIHWREDELKTLTIKEKLSIRTKEAMQRPEVRKKYLEGIKRRDNKSGNPEVREKRRKTMIATMAQKFPVENRYNPLEKGSDELLEIYRQRTVDLWQNRSEEELIEIGNKISEGLKNSEAHQTANVNRANKSKAQWANRTEEEKQRIRDKISATRRARGSYK